jgi:hypothetical protein
VNGAAEFSHWLFGFPTSHSDFNIIVATPHFFSEVTRAALDTRKKLMA